MRDGSFESGIGCVSIALAKLLAGLWKVIGTSGPFCFLSADNYHSCNTPNVSIRLLDFNWSVSLRLIAANAHALCHPHAWGRRSASILSLNMILRIPFFQSLKPGTHTSLLKAVNSTPHRLYTSLLSSSSFQKPLLAIHGFFQALLAKLLWSVLRMVYIQVYCNLRCVTSVPSCLCSSSCSQCLQTASLDVSKALSILAGKV